MSDKLPEVGPWARDKLDRLRKYLSAYTKILANQSWVRGYVYVDAFAGSGRVGLRPARSADPTNDIFDLGQEFRADEGARSLLDGSPRIAGGTAAFARLGSRDGAGVVNEMRIA